MKHLRITLFLLAFLAAGTASAQESRIDEKREAIREQKEEWLKQNEVIREKRELFRTESQDARADLQEQRLDIFGSLKDSRSELEMQLKGRREALRAEILEIRKERATARKAFVEKHFADAIEKMHALAGRLQAKIDEEEARGTDAGSAQEHLDMALNSLAEAEASFEELKAAAVSDTDETSVERPRGLAKEVEVSLKESREHFRLSLAALKEAAGPRPSESATTAQ